MKFLLVDKKAVHINFRRVGSSALGSDQYLITGVVTNSVSPPVGFKVRSADPDPHELRKGLCDKLTEVFQAQSIICYLNMTTHFEKLALHNTQFKLTINAHGDNDIGKLIAGILGEGATLYASITLRGRDSPVKTKEMAIPSPHNKQTICLDPHFNAELDEMLKSVFHLKASGHNDVPFMQGEVTIGITTKGDTLLPAVHDKMEVNKRMLKDGIAADVIIVASKGVELKCHQSFLEAHSDVFRTMFATDMQESKTRRVNMTERSAESVRAMLDYMYCWDLSKAEASSRVSLELLKLGHFCNIPALVEKLKNILLLKPNTWYEAEVAIQLYVLVKRLEGQNKEPLDKKGVAELKKKSVMAITSNAEQLKNSLTYQELAGEVDEEFRTLFEDSVKVYGAGAST